MKDDLIGYPSTYKALLVSGQAQDRPKLFDPSLLHFARAFRAGDPRFENEADARLWHLARRGAIDHLLRLIAGSKWSGHLVLRGSLLLQAWLGARAREPGDIDWVFQPASARVGVAVRLFSELKQMVAASPIAGAAVIEASGITTDDIWTYDRVPGRRIVFPWRAPRLPGGEVQMDVVFGEEMLDAPRQVLVPTLEGAGVGVWAASKELSLAWKLLWLWSDGHPQGKDLYDATLLAEHLVAERTPLSFSLLLRVFEHSGDWDRMKKYRKKTGQVWDDRRELTPSHVAPEVSGWDHFEKEYPRVEGDAEHWRARLERALEPTFQE